MADLPKSDSQATEFVLLYTQHERRLYRYVATLLPHPADAEEVLQETAKKLWEQFDRYRRAEPFLPWACSIAYYEVLTFRQRERTRRKYFSPEVVEEVAQVWASSQDLLTAQSQALAQCLQKLPQDERQLLRQRYDESDTLTELAGRTGRTANALYKTLQRIREKLLDCVNRTLAAEGLL